MTDFLYEEMIRAETPHRVCRIWRQFGIGGLSDESLRELAIHLMKSDFNLTEIVNQLVYNERVNSVEVINKATGDGICVHKDWP